MGQDTEELRREIESTRADMTGTLEAIGDRVSPGRVMERNKNKVVLGAQSVRDRVMGTASNTQDRIAETAHSARESVSDTAGQAADAIKHAPEAITHKAEGAPLVAGAIAFGVGFLFAAAIPASRAETNASTKVMDSLEPVKEQLVETVHEMGDHLKEPAKQAAQNLKDVAADGVQSVTSVAKAAAEETKHQAADSVTAVKSGETTNAS